MLNGTGNSGRSSGGDRENSLGVADERSLRLPVWRRHQDAGRARVEAHASTTPRRKHVRYFAMHLPPVLTDRERDP